MAYAKKIMAKAKQKWIQGEKIPTIAKKLNVPAKTIEGWKRRYHWAEKANEVHEKIEKSFWEKIGDKLILATMDYITLAQNLGKAASEQLPYYQGAGQLDDDQLKKLKDVAKIALDGTSIIKNIQPEAREQVAEIAMQQKVEQLEQAEKAKLRAIQN